MHNNNHLNRAVVKLSDNSYVAITHAEKKYFNNIWAAIYWLQDIGFDRNNPPLYSRFV